MRGKIFLERAFDNFRARVERHAVNRARKGRVAAMVAPISIDNFQLGNRRRAIFFVAEIFLAKLQVVKIHGKPAFRQKIFQRGVVHVVEVAQNFHVGRNVGGNFQRGGQVESRFAGFNRVNAIRFDFGEVGVGNFAAQRNDACAVDCRQVLAGDELNALGGGVGALVELPRQILNRKSFRGVDIGGQFAVKIVDVRFAENNIAHVQKIFVAQAFHVVAHEQPHARKFNVQSFAEVFKQLTGGHVETRAFLNVNSLDHWQSLKKFLNVVVTRR